MIDDHRRLRINFEYRLGTGIMMTHLREKLEKLLRDIW